MASYERIKDLAEAMENKIKETFDDKIKKGLILLDIPQQNKKNESHNCGVIMKNGSVEQPGPIRAGTK